MSHQFYHFHNTDKMVATIWVINHGCRKRTILPNSPFRQGKFTSCLLFMLLQFEIKIGKEILIRKLFSKTNVYFSVRDNKYSECRKVSKHYHKGLSLVQNKNNSMLCVVTTFHGRQVVLGSEMTQELLIFSPNQKRACKTWGFLSSNTFIVT